MKHKSTHTRMKSTEEHGEGKELYMIHSFFSLYHGLIMFLAANGTGSIKFMRMWLLAIAAGWLLKCIGLYYLLTFRQTLQKSLDATLNADGQCPKAYFRSNPRQRSGMFFPSQSPSLNPTEQDFYCWRQNWRENTKEEQGGTEDSCSNGQAEHHSASGDVYLFQMICIKIIFYDCQFVQLLLVP